ncbi:MAG: toll/interleukin-1 receptor domain-containing protein [Pseudomonadota bacterium]
MADEEHLEILKSGVKAWNKWREKNKDVIPDLSNAEISNTSLYAINFIGANLSGADLSLTDLSVADLRGANLSNAALAAAVLRGTKLSGANLDGAILLDTVFGNIDLTEVSGLENIQHRTACVVDHHTLQRSKDVPISFWRGCGLPDALIDYMPSLSGDAIQFYSCFISYSSKDQEFADRLHADLQNAGVRCWFAPHDLPIGAKTWDGTDQAIRTRDKVLLILSEGAIASDWVEDEVTTAFAEERRRDELVLFPVRLDNSVMETREAWAGKLRDNRNIGDFTSWKDHDAYKRSFNRVLRDLKPTNGEEG